MRRLVSALVLAALVPASALVPAIAWADLAPPVVREPAGAVFRCSGDDDQTVDGQTFSSTTGPAAIIEGNCNVTFKNVRFQGPIGLQVSGNANVVLTGGSIAGKQAAILASGNANVLGTGVEVRGKVKKSANAQVVLKKH